MSVLLMLRKGLLLKSFFICTLASTVSAKTLIFQSSEAGAQPDRTSAGAVSNAAPEKTTSRTAVLPAPNVNSELFFMVEQLKQEVMMLRGIVEEKDYEIRQMQELSKDRYRDMDQRIQDLAKQLAEVGKNSESKVLSGGSPVSSSVSGSAVNGVVPIGVSGEVVPVQGASAGVDGAQETEEQKVAYQHAYNYVRDKNFPEAIDALHAYVEKYPEGDLTGNAFYWLGEVYLVLPKLEQAKQAFSIVVKTFPGHRKLPDAMYKLAVTLDRLQDPAGAEQYLKQVQQLFPNSTAAKLAGNYTISR